MRRIKKKYLAMGTVPVVILLAFVMLSGGKEVAATKLQKGNITRVVEDNGYVQAVTDYDLQAQQTARVAQVLVETGQTVQQGDTLVILENLDLSLQTAETNTRLSQAQSAVRSTEAAYEKAKLALEDAQTNYQRYKQLYEAGAISKSEFEQVSLQAENLQKNLQEAEANLVGAQTQASGLNQMLGQLKQKEDQLLITSPVDGIVLSLGVKEGESLNPGVSIARVGNLSSLEIKAYILSDDLAEVKTGQQVKVTAPVLGGKELSGSVQRIYPQAEEKVSALGVIQRRVPVMISLQESANLQPGYEVRVAIETASYQDILVIPREAVRTTKEGMKEVLQVVNNKIKVQQVQTGQTDREYIEITAGLQEGDLVVADASTNLAEKTKVKPVIE